MRLNDAGRLTPSSAGRMLRTKLAQLAHLVRAKILQLAQLLRGGIEIARKEFFDRSPDASGSR